MIRRSTKFPAGFRLFAVAWLFGWLAAQTLCIHHCAAGNFANKAAGNACCTKKSPGSSKAPPGKSSSPCGGLKAAKLETKTGLSTVSIVATAMLAPAFPVMAFSLPATPAEPAFVGYVRARFRADFVFRPEVSLGAALRSHAPPERA